MNLEKYLSLYLMYIQLIEIGKIFYEKSSNY